MPAQSSAVRKARMSPGSARLTAGEGGDDGLQFALLVLPAGEFEAQGIAPGFRFALLANEGFRVAAGFLGKAQQAVAFASRLSSLQLRG